MGFEYLETERLLLHRYTGEDICYIYANFPKEKAKSLFGLVSDEDYAKEKLKSEANGSSGKQILHFKLALKTNGDIIGGAGFHNYNPTHLRAELGYALTKEDLKKKGYMFEALEAIIKYGFENMNFNRIEAFINPENTASLHLIEKLGFIREGYLRSHFIRDGVAEDSVLFSLLHSEYKR